MEYIRLISWRVRNMVSDTSIEAFVMFCNSGKRVTVRSKVYEALKLNVVPSTQREIIQKFFRGKHAGGGITSRFSELVDMGEITVDHEGKCSVTGNMAKKYRVTTEVEKKNAPKREKKKDKVERAVYYLEQALENENSMMDMIVRSQIEGAVAILKTV